MGWWDDESVGQRTARLQGENAKRMHEATRERDDINHQRSQDAAYQRQNWQHKTMAFEAEQRAAYREGRRPIYASPAEVPDMPRVAEPEPVAKSSEPLHPAIIAAFVFIIVVVFVLPALGPLLGTVLRIIFLVLLAAVVLLTAIWLVLRQTAKDDPVKIRRAMQFNPLFVGKIAVLTALDLMKARSARKKAGTE